VDSRICPGWLSCRQTKVTKDLNRKGSQRCCFRHRSSFCGTWRVCTNAICRTDRLFFFLWQQLATACNSLQQLATACNSLQQLATACNSLQQLATACNSLQQLTTAYNSLQQLATACNSLQQLATGAFLNFFLLILVEVCHEF
jgi:hypothetical protein